MKTRLLSILLMMLASVMPMKLWAADGNYLQRKESGYKMKS